MTQRTFIPGSQWLYFKIYTGYKTADDLLINVLYPYLKELSNIGVIGEYFFIRYNDPDFHLRLRLHIKEPQYYGDIFHKFYTHLQPCIENGTVIKILCDTYNREIERYGEQTIELVEQLFKLDSEAVIELLALLKTLPLQQREQHRWQLSLLLLDDTLAVFGYALQDKVRLLNRMSDAYKKEFGYTNHAYTKQLNDKYRNSRQDIEQRISTRNTFSLFENVLHSRHKRMSIIAYKIEEVSRIIPETPLLDDLIYSIQHMTMNRWFRSHNRLHEMVVYDFLNKYYQSMRARTKQGI